MAGEGAFDASSQQAAARLGAPLARGSTPLIKCDAGARDDWANVVSAARLGELCGVAAVRDEVIGVLRQEARDGVEHQLRLAVARGRREAEDTLFALPKDLVDRIGGRLQVRRRLELRGDARNELEDRFVPDSVFFSAPDLAQFLLRLPLQIELEGLH